MRNHQDSPPLSAWMWPGEVADAFGVTTGTVARWADEGRIPVHPLPSGRRRFLRSEIAKLLPASESA